MPGHGHLLARPAYLPPPLSAVSPLNQATGHTGHTGGSEGEDRRVRGTVTVTSELSLASDCLEAR